MSKRIALSPASASLASALGRPVGRREVLRRLGWGLAAVPLVNLVACSDDSGATGPDAATDPDAAASPDGSTATDWASGGTAAMVDKASYPDPFTAALTSCALVVTTTEGPCTTSDDQAREDISEGWTGLPVRLALKVVDTSCNPLVGATVKVWHTNRAGSYSGETPNPNMCLSDQSYSTADFFRGVRTTDASGVVYFDTCFPGWYNGRAIHIHFQVKSGSTSYRVSQLFFPEDVTTAIFASHSEYASYGQPNTTFSNDNIMAGIPTASRDRHIFTVARMTDGAMLASKVVTVTG